MNHGLKKIKNVLNLGSYPGAYPVNLIKDPDLSNQSLRFIKLDYFSKFKTKNLSFLLLFLIRESEIWNENFLKTLRFSA